MKDPTPPMICTATGELRGERVAHLFGPGGRFPTPSRLFARRLPAHMYASRDMYLLWPLAQRLGVPVNATFAEDEFASLAETLLAEREAICAGPGLQGGPLPSLLGRWGLQLGALAALP